MITSFSYPAPAVGVALPHMMNYMIGLGPEHIIASGNTGLCTHECRSASGACEHADCSEVPASRVIFHAALYDQLRQRCTSGATLPTRSPCNPPTKEETCAEADLDPQFSLRCAHHAHAHATCTCTCTCNVHMRMQRATCTCACSVHVYYTCCMCIRSLG